MRLETREAGFSYILGREPVLQRVTISVDSRERVGLSAPSGYGKSTLCRLLSGYLQPDHGEVLLDGHELPRRGYCPVQLVHQHPEQAVNPRLRLQDTLAEGGELDPVLLENLGIETAWLQRFPGELSGGEMQRFCIARALNPITRFLIADEITTMLDMITQAQIWDLLLRVSEEREMGLVIVSHSRPLLERVCTRIVDMEAINN